MRRKTGDGVWNAEEKRFNLAFFLHMVLRCSFQAGSQMRTLIQCAKELKDQKHSAFALHVWMWIGSLSWLRLTVPNGTSKGECWCDSISHTVLPFASFIFQFNHQFICCRCSYLLSSEDRRTTSAMDAKPCWTAAAWNLWRRGFWFGRTWFLLVIIIIIIIFIYYYIILYSINNPKW